MIGTTLRIATSVSVNGDAGECGGIDLSVGESVEISGSVSHHMKIYVYLDARKLSMRICELI